jgi:hypothetical protein
MGMWISPIKQNLQSIFIEPSDMPDGCFVVHRVIMVE